MQSNQHPEPPEYLSDKSKTLWCNVIHRCRSVGRQALLQSALEALDRCDQVKAILDSGDLVSVTQTTGTVHVNPLLKIERDERALFVRIWDQLGLGWDSNIDSRPGKE